MRTVSLRVTLLCVFVGLCAMLAPAAYSVVYPDNETQFLNQDPENETRRSDHFRMNFGHYNRDSGMGGYPVWAG